MVLKITEFNKMNKYLIITLFSFISIVSSGQKTWTLEECINQAIKENLQLEQKKIDAKLKTEELLQSRMDLLPTLNANLGADNSYGRSIDPSTNDIVSTQLFQASASAGTSLMLFQGFVNLNRIQYNKLNVLKGALDEEVMKNDIAFKVMNAYFDLCFTKGQLQIAKDQLELSNMNLSKIRIMVDAGIKARTDIAEMEARLAADDYKLTQAQNSVSKSELVLQQFLNLRNGTPIEIECNTGNATFEPLSMPDPDSVFNLASGNLPQFRQMTVDSKLSKLTYSIAKGGRAPSLRAQAGYGSGYYDTYRDSDGNRILFSEQIRNNAYQYVGVNMSIPLFNGWQSNKTIHTARWNMEKTKLDNEIKKREFYSEIENACLAVKSAADEFRSARVQEAASALNLELAEKKWEQGTSNLLELTDVRNRLASARAEMLRTQLQYELKLKTILIFTGSLKF